MTLEELNRSMEIHQRLERAYEMLEALEIRINTRSPLDGMPRGTDISDKVGNMAIAIADLKDQIMKMEDQLEISDERIRKFANSFEDQRLMMIIQLRFISGLTWAAVADCLGLGESTVKNRFRCDVLGIKQTAKKK